MNIQLLLWLPILHFKLPFRLKIDFRLQVASWLLWPGPLTVLEGADRAQIPPTGASHLAGLGGLGSNGPTNGLSVRWRGWPSRGARWGEAQHRDLRRGKGRSWPCCSRTGRRSWPCCVCSWRPSGPPGRGVRCPSDGGCRGPPGRRP